MSNEVTSRLDLSVVTLFPEMLTALTQWGVTGRAVQQGLCTVHAVNPRNFATDRHGTVDDRPYGGGPGMVMKAPLLSAAVASAKQQQKSDAMVIAMTPQGQRFDDRLARELVDRERLVLIAGRYEGMDERFLASDVDLELSVGDFVVSGGELPAMLVMDALIRLVPGVLGHDQSAEEDSFVDGLLDYPHFTRPEVYEGRAVPAVLLSGDHGAIADWRRAQALRRTVERRPDLMSADDLSEEDRACLRRWELHD